MTVWAAGAEGLGWPNMQVTVNGIGVYNANVTTENYAPHTFGFFAPAGDTHVRIYLTNDLYLPGATPPIDRNLFIDKATINDLGNNATCDRGASDDELTVSLVVRPDPNWADGYCADLYVTNNGSSVIDSWYADIDLGGSSFNHGWGVSASGSGLQRFEGIAWAESIQPSETKNTGFCGLRPNGSGLVPNLVAWGLD